MGPSSIQTNDLAEYAVKAGAAAEWKATSLAVILHADKRSGENKAQAPNNGRLVVSLSLFCFDLSDRFSY